MTLASIKVAGFVFLSTIISTSWKDLQDQCAGIPQTCCMAFQP